MFKTASGTTSVASYFEHFMTSFVVKRVQNNGKPYVIFFTTNLNRHASEQAFVLRDRSRQLRGSVLLYITAGSQSETRTVPFCCKKIFGHTDT